MTSKVSAEIAQLKQAIDAMESQRTVLGDQVVDVAIASMRGKLAELEHQSATTEQQRKLVTILFMDVAESTRMTQLLDPEEISDLLDNTLVSLAEPVSRQGGTVTRFQGDGFLAVFGLPISHEIDPEQAIRAGLEIQAQAQRIAGELETERGIRDFQVRVGIHTGVVVIGGQTESDRTIMGSPVNLAARLQAAAPPGGVIISHDTYRHVRGIFDIESLGPIHAKGFSEPIPIYRVKREKAHAFRLISHGIEGLETHMIGRDAELNEMQAAFDSVIEHGILQAITIVGEVGLGKSRLMFEFDDWVDLLPKEVFYFKGRALPATRNIPYSLLHNLFSIRFQIQDSDPIQVVREKIEAGVAEGMRQPSLEMAGKSHLTQDIPADFIMRAHFIGQLLGFDFSTSPYVKGGLQNSEYFRDQALTYLVDYFEALSKRDPVVMLLEDLHWGDDSSVDALTHLVGSLEQRPVLLICSARPEFRTRRPHWGIGQSFHSWMELTPLNLSESHKLVDEILQKEKILPMAMNERIIQNAQGNPFYIEEILKMLIESGEIQKQEADRQTRYDPSSEVLIPSTLTEVLQARLESLNKDERSTLQQASVVGHIFWDEAIQYMNTEPEELPGQVEESSSMALPQGSTKNEKNIQGALAQLRNRELIYPQIETTFIGTREYIIKHFLLRDVAYESVLKRQRRVYHSLAAGWLLQKTQNSQRAEEFAAIIAEHLDNAGQGEEAAVWYLRAGKQAARQFAHAEALRYLNRALELISPIDIPNQYQLFLTRETVHSRQGDRKSQAEDLKSLMMLATSLDDSVKSNSSRLSPGFNQSFRAEAGLHLANYQSDIGDYESSISSAQQVVNWASEDGMLESEAKAYQVIGRASWHKGDYERAQIALTQALLLANQGNFPIVAADTLRILGALADVQGQFDQAIQYIQDALAKYVNEKDRQGESTALNSLGVVYYKLGDYAKARNFFGRSLQIKQEIGNRYGEGITLCDLGLAARKQRDMVAAQEYLTRSLEICQLIDDREGEATASAGLGNIMIYAGEYEAAREHLEHALALCRQIGDRQGECDTLSEMARYYLEIGSLDSAFHSARESLEIAKELHLPDEEAYILISLGDTCLSMNNNNEAREYFQKALELRQELELNEKTMEPLIGLAQVALAQGDPSTAKQVIEPVIQSLLQQGMLEIEEPVRNFLASYQILQKLNDPRALAILQEGYRRLIGEAKKLGDENREHMFLEHVPQNREILDAWNELQNS